MNQPLNVAPPVSSELNLRAHWMPFSANRNFQKDPRIIVAAEGSWLTDKGRKVYDSLSGLWTCGAGHSRKEIQEAVARQLGTLDYSPGFQVRPSAVLPVGREDRRVAARRTEPRVLHRFRLRVRRHLDQDGPRLLAPERPAAEDQADRPRPQVNVAGTSLGGIGGNRRCSAS